MALHDVIEQPEPALRQQCPARPARRAGRAGQAAGDGQRVEERVPVEVLDVGEPPPAKGQIEDPARQRGGVRPAAVDRPVVRERARECEQSDQCERKMMVEPYSCSGDSQQGLRL